MDIAKILNLGCALILIVCLVFAVVNASKLQSAMEENERLAERAESLLEAMESLPVQAPAEEDDTTALPTESPTVPSNPTYWIRSAGNRIGIYTADNLPIRMIDVDPTHLPQGDREALEIGIPMDSWAAVLSYISDYTS